MSAKIYRFESKTERLKRAQALANDVELLLTEGERAVSYLLTGLRDGDTDLQRVCAIALFSWHKEAALEPFYQLMADSAQGADLRRHRQPRRLPGGEHPLRNETAGSAALLLPVRGVEPDRRHQPGRDCRGA